mmetsp:Transcript_2460/g.8846  ORF Transcript_2460/g.8846 Transcript_2460/m.8846 type:complete len:514 (+) Transcript_2460:289-1830(+)
MHCEHRRPSLMPGRPRIASRSSSGGGPNCSWMYSSANTPRLVPCSITSAAPCRLVLTVTGGATAASCPSVVAAVADSADAEAATEHSFSSVNFSSPTAGDRGMLTVTREEPVSLHSKRSCMTCCCCCTRGKKLGTVTATTLASSTKTRGGSMPCSLMPSPSVRMKSSSDTTSSSAVTWASGAVSAARSVNLGAVRPSSTTTSAVAGPSPPAPSSSSPDGRCTRRSMTRPGTLEPRLAIESTRSLSEGQSLATLKVMEPCGSTGSRTVTGVSPSLLQLKVTLRSSGSSSLLAAPAAACCGGGRRRVPPCASAPPSVGLQAALPASTDGTPSSSGARRWRFACMYSSRKGALSGTCSNPSYPPSWVRRKRGCTWPSRTTSGATTSFILATRGPCTTCTPESVAMSTPGIMAASWEAMRSAAHSLRMKKCSSSSSPPARSTTKEVDTSPVPARRQPKLSCTTAGWPTRRSDGLAPPAAAASLSPLVRLVTMAGLHKPSMPYTSTCRTVSAAPCALT